MADNQSTATTDAVDTSTNDDISQAESDLEESDVSFDDAEDTDDDEQAESSESDEDESANESTEEEQEESEEDADEGQADTPEKPEAKDKQQAAREAFERREAARLAKEQAKREAEQQYIKNAENDQDKALRVLQVNAYNLQVQTNQNALQNGIDKAMAHIDLMSSKDPVIRDEMLNAVDEFEAYNVVKDKNGDPVEVRGDLFEHLQKKAAAIRRLAGLREKQRSNDRANTRARTVVTPSRKPKEAAKDPLLEGFDEEAQRP